MTLNWLKRAAILLALCLAVGSVSGCDGSGDASDTGTAETGDTSDATVEAGEIFKVGYIFSGDCDEAGVSADCNDQRLRALSHTNIESVYIDNVHVTDFNDAVEMLVEAGCTHIVSTSPIYTHSMTAVAAKYMNIRFVNYGAVQRSVNVYAYTENVFQSLYAAGLAAAFNSESEKIGIVVDPFLSYGTAVVNAAALGAQFVYDDAQIVVASAERDSEIHQAVDALVAKGCDVIICYTESAETAEYCEKLGVKFIGNLDYSDYESDYKNMIMYFYSDKSSFFLAQFKSIALKSWSPDAYIATLANEVLQISDALPAAADGTQDIVDALVPKIANGSAYIFTGELKDTAGNVRVMQGRELVFGDIYAMNWYVYGVDDSLGTFVQSTNHPDENELVIKY